MAQAKILGGGGDAWCFGALIKGRSLFGEGLDLELLREVMSEVSAAAGVDLVASVPFDDLSDAFEVSCVVGVPVLVATLNDDSAGDVATATADAEGVRAALQLEVPGELFSRLAEACGLEDEAGVDAVWLAPGGWSSAQLQAGETTARTFSENEPPELAVELPDGCGATVTVRPA